MLIRDKKIIKEFKSQSVPLGITYLTPDKFDTEMFSLRYGDRLLAATDGIMEAENEHGDMYGKSRILESIESSDHPEYLFDKILNETTIDRIF